MFKSASLSDSTRRMLRTWYQGVITIVVIVPVLITFLPAHNDQVIKISGIALGAVGVVSKLVNLLEEKGLIPAWLKPDASLPGVEPGTMDTPKDPSEMSNAEQTAAEELGTVPPEGPPITKAVRKAPAKKAQTAAVRNRQGRR